MQALDHSLKGKWNQSGEDLPNDTVVVLFSFMDPRTLLRSSLVSKRWYSLLCGNDVLWRPLLLHLFKGDVRILDSIYFRESKLSFKGAFQRFFKPFSMINYPLNDNNNPNSNSDRNDEEEKELTHCRFEISFLDDSLERLSASLDITRGFSINGEVVVIVRELGENPMVEWYFHRHYFSNQTKGKEEEATWENIDFGSESSLYPSNEYLRVTHPFGSPLERSDESMEKVVISEDGKWIVFLTEEVFRRNY